ncbi:MAG: calcium/sodium antiporter [Planctomycetaceae bacterium]
MNAVVDIAWFVVGLVLMIYGADLLVRGASRLALMVGVSPLVVGLTVVAFGTSAPEFAVSFKAAYADQASLCLGNVVGSNIFNVLFILGISSIVVPLVVAPQLIRFDLPLLIGISLLTLLLGIDGRYSRLDGALLFGGLIAYTGGQVYASRKKRVVQSAEDLEVAHGPAGRSKALQLAIDLGLIVLGLTLLVLGANWLVDTSVKFARWLEVSELVIGLTIVAVGTSLPEVATSIVASIKGERDIAVGNVIGSNLFNLLGVLGLAAVVARSGLEASSEAIHFDIPVMIAVVFLALPIFWTARMVSRGEGMVLLGYYIAYTIYLILNATDNPALHWYTSAMMYGAIPLTIIGLAVSVWRAKRASGAEQPA